MRTKVKRYAQVGLGARSWMYTEAILKHFKDHAVLAGLCDDNRGRLELRNRWIAERAGGSPAPAYLAADFDRMIREQKPDVVIVTTKDSFHDEYIVRAMRLGCDVITEKPLTTEAKKCARILKAMRETGRDLRVTFNYRYSPPRLQVKKLLAEGAIGKVLSVEFQWLLNTSHGADYFRRWHREKMNSGGLLVHKATHHFDLVNWWIAASPAEVFAMGRRGFYGAQSGMAERYGLNGHAERCAECGVAEKCGFVLDLKKYQDMRELYYECEKHDGYFRDRCVFGKTMDIEDGMCLTVRYDSGALMSYALNAFCPWEGYRVAFNGVKGRLEHTCVESVYVSGDGAIPGETVAEGSRILVFPHFGPVRNVPIETGVGGHGGGDWPLLESLFLPVPPPDPLRCAAGFAEGARSILVGIAANKSIKTGRPVLLDSLVSDLPAVEHMPIKEW